MTSHYIDLQLQPDPDFPAGQLMGALFSKLHRRLVALDDNSIGVSFPEYGMRPRTIGERLRLHGTSADLAALMAARWMGGMHDFVLLQDITAIPREVSHRTVARRQFKTNADRLRRRRMRRHNESAAEVLQRIPDSVERKVSLPFVQVRSASTGQRFSLFIEHGPQQSTAQPGPFNSYGLSRTATIPWF
ncbi:MAG TPA: type I-F CRISPR-associated endoribonuclease Cas6/Csy4 [Salinisphaeraceae bacterium]|nr:type I-F CRISPR-associated endoribonuclease Cas6/Csy4 [Salinisphaeraceae bacterium]